VLYCPTLKEAPGTLRFALPEITPRAASLPVATPSRRKRRKRPQERHKSYFPFHQQEYQSIKENYP
jgi:hypothetical protein